LKKNFFSSTKTKILGIILLIAFDQWSKSWVRNNLIDNPMLLINNFLELNYQKNTGIAFSLLNDSALVLTMVNSGIVAGLIGWLISRKKLSWVFVFVIAGGIGNLIDRYTLGYVVDFINPLFINFAVFNIADAYLNIGAGLMLIRIFILREKTLI
jgi:signal peptidase II